MYTTTNYKTKKALKQDVEELNQLMEQQTLDEMQALRRNRLMNKLGVYQPNGDLTGVSAPQDGKVTLEGPHYPEPHKWYAQAVVRNGVIIQVR